MTTGNTPVPQATCDILYVIILISASEIGKDKYSKMCNDSVIILDEIFTDHRWHEDGGFVVTARAIWRENGNPILPAFSAEVSGSYKNQVHPWERKEFNSGEKMSAASGRVTKYN